ncbi:EAL domain-containing protein [Herbaspirillum sp. SJZ107]|uniref:bifunctional diguanylate cyclase/phosphodiesterase n=1 Tax=Herbaspirillum sp. SJZ107 TaxID=2572881 RepID=UPI0011524D48|nr:EAL domain-containing protein [Herbaspirillum sp. SJZ107]TQK11616.1 PAS domain S-box-containing protein/diguanylate cyclase (GGDEF)-like protein [Herbaspirillum sp. SJZ107]
MSTQKARPGRLRARLPSLLAVLTLLTGLGITALLFADARSAEQEKARSAFLQFAETRVAAVRRTFNEALEVLQATNALFGAMGQVSRAQFTAFAHPLLASHPYIQAVVMERIVYADERAAYERAQAVERPGFRIRERRDGGLVPAAPRDRYLVIEYIEPADGNTGVLGYDALFYSDENEAFVRAVDSGAPASTVMLPLIQRSGRMGIVLVQPLYRPGTHPAAQETRRAAAVGDTAVVIDVADMVGGSLASGNLLARAGMSIELHGPYDGTRRLAYRHDTLERKTEPAWRTWMNDTVFTTRRHFDVAGQRWELRLAGHSSEMVSGTGPLTMLVLGVLASLAAAAYVQSRVRRTRRIEELVIRRTADLREALVDLRLYRRAIDASANAVILISATRPGFPIVHVNPAFERMRGYAGAEVVGRSLLELGEKEPDQAAVAELRSAMRERREGQASMRLRCKDGRELFAEVYIAPVNDREGRTTHYVMTQYDVTTAKRYEAELESHARFDTLTGLANRSLLHDRIEGALNFSGGRPSVWVAALDLDHFKFVNDTLGHQAGDRLLKAVAARIAGAVERSDTVARTGGDEFVLVLPGRADEGEAADTVRTVLAALAHPLVVDGHELVLTGSAGVAGFPLDGNDAATLIQHAEVAMYRAKETGRNTVQFYTSSMNARARDRLALEMALRSALSQNEFELYYQPQVDLLSGSVVGVEALIRWRHPSMGMVRPDRFINLAEETGLIVPIGAWVLRTACRQHSDWQDAGYGPLRVGVNLSARQFADPGLLRQIERVLEETGMPPSSLEIEITESLVMEDVEGAIRTMGELKRMGIKLSIDDFGTGYSSLSYLRRFPVDVLKIDRSFVRDIACSEDDAAMVSAIIELARGLRMRTIAEGVETEAQLDTLKRRGCDEVQGHVYGKAEPGPTVEALLRNGRRVDPHPASS